MVSYEINGKQVIGECSWIPQRGGILVPPVVALISNERLAILGRRLASRCRGREWDPQGQPTPPEPLPSDALAQVYPVANLSSGFRLMLALRAL